MRPAAILMLMVLAGCASDGTSDTQAPAGEGSPAAGDPGAPPAPAEPVPPAATDVPPAPARFEIVFTGGSPQAAMILVRKRVSGRWVERKYVVLPKNDEANRTGDIGKVEKEKDPATGEFVDADYRTGFVLLEIRKDTGPHAGGAGRRLVIRYADAAGKEHELPMEADQKAD